MRAILIDPESQSITEVDYNGDFNQINEYIKADCFDVANLKDGDGVFVDDEGLLKPSKHFFLHPHYSSWLAGRGLIVGSDAMGESVDAKADLDFLKATVLFASLPEEA